MDDFRGRAGLLARLVRTSRAGWAVAAEPVALAVVEDSGLAPDFLAMEKTFLL
jgi:hypothetical protein